MRSQPRRQALYLFLHWPDASLQPFEQVASCELQPATQLAFPELQALSQLE